MTRKLKEQQGEFSPPTVKQHLAALPMLFDWLVTGHIIDVNPRPCRARPQVRRQERQNSRAGSRRITRTARQHPRRQKDQAPAWYGNGGTRSYRLAGSSLDRVGGLHLRPRQRRSADEG